MPDENVIPDEGDLVWVEFSPYAGHEQARRRPGLVLTPRDYHARSPYAIVCPVTKNLKPYPYKVPLPDGLRVTGAVLVDQAKSINRRARHIEIADKVPSEFLDEVRSRLAALIMPNMVS